MKSLFSLGLGALIAIGATLIHQTFPPLGLLIALSATFAAIWWVGRYFGKKKFKVVALIGWLAVIIKAGTFGVGQELLIQGDNAGSALLLAGFVLGIVAAAVRA